MDVYKVSDRNIYIYIYIIFNKRKKEKGYGEALSIAL